MTVESVWMTKANAMGLHIGASSASTGGEKSIISKIFVDSPGMGTGSIGHFGGLSADHPAYPGIGFSRQCDGVVIYGFEVYNTYSAPLCQGIGSIANSDCFDIEICSGVIADMVYGGFQIHGSTGDAPYDIMLHDIKVRNCAPVDLTQSWGAGAGSDAWFHSYLGSFAGTALGSRITLRNMDFIDSPLGVQSVTATLSDCNFVASVINKSSSLYIMTAGTRVNLSNVESVRPKTTGTRPASYQFSCNIYVNAATVHGNDVRIIGGYNGMRVQSGADVQISNFYGEDCYEYCAAVFSASTKLHLTSPKIRSTITLSSPYAAIENNNGGGAGGLTTVISPDIELTTNNAAQYGIRLSPNSVAGTATKVQGGVIKLIGTSTTPILSGGGTALNVVAGTLLSHTFTPGAAEISTGTVVSANI